MSQDNEVKIIGTVGSDPEIRFTPGGDAVCSFSVAWSPRKKNANGEWESGDTTWFRCTAWRDMAEHIAASITKGTRVVVIGQISAREWEDKDGNKRTSVDINVDECAPSLKWATVNVERTERSGGGRSSGSSRAPDPVYGDETPF